MNVGPPSTAAISAESERSMVPAAPPARLDEEVADRRMLAGDRRQALKADLGLVELVDAALDEAERFARCGPDHDRLVQVGEVLEDRVGPENRTEMEVPKPVGEGPGLIPRGREGVRHVPFHLDVAKAPFNHLDLGQDLIVPVGLGDFGPGSRDVEPALESASRSGSGTLARWPK